MKPSKEYKENLKNNIITSDMLYDCIYSVNKRAKNYRDLKNFYNRYYYSNLNKMKEYYDMKDFLIKSLLKAKLIHRQNIETWKGKIALYFLYYEMEQGSFHCPIEESDIKSYKQLEIERIDDDFYTEGKEIQDLISIQFVKKVIDKIKEGNFIYQK
jgi:hypothetical protein